MKTIVIIVIIASSAATPWYTRILSVGSNRTFGSIYKQSTNALLPDVDSNTINQTYTGNSPIRKVEVVCDKDTRKTSILGWHQEKKPYRDSQCDEYDVQNVDNTKVTLSDAIHFIQNNNTSPKSFHTFVKTLTSRAIYILTGITIGRSLRTFVQSNDYAMVEEVSELYIFIPAFV